MCILCVIQKWSRRVAAMLPWLVIPLIGLWALSQLLPPAFRFEITSLRLACLFVLLVTLFWYEILMPQLSAWRVRRNAFLRERKRFEAFELQKLRKTATRHCRNCLNPYRDQNPGGGRFMCSYCGHISKRPVLDLPVPPGMGISNSGIIKGLVGKGGKLLHGKRWAESGWTCGQEWPENGNWVSGSIAGKSCHWRKNGSGIFGRDEQCLTEKSYSGVGIFACRLLTSFFLSIRWIWRKLFKVSSPMDEPSSSAEQKSMLTKTGESGANSNESRGEKARRKAEEKRQARLEKELLEEEERKQREDVARLVEERRRLRDEKMEAEKYHSKSSPTSKERDGKKEAEKKRRKDRDRGSSRSNSDAEELEKRAGKETEKKREQNDHRGQHKVSSEDFLGHGNGAKNVLAKNVSRPSTGNKYFDRMKGTFLSSSKAFTGGSFFGKGANVPVTPTKETRPISTVDHVHASALRRDIHPHEHVAGKSYMNGDDTNISRPVISEHQPSAAPKKSWHQLFTRSSSVPASSNVNVICRPNPNLQAEVQSYHFSSQLSSVQTFDNPVSIRLPSPFIIPSYTNGPTSSNLGFSPAIEPMFPSIQDKSHDIIPEEMELFEDPCYVPDPSSLLGPVSESLNNFLLDTGLEKPHGLKKSISASSEPNKPSPIESPLSRVRIADEKHNGSNRLPSTPKGKDHGFHMDDVNGTNEKGTYQMWNSPPLVQDGLGFLDGLSLLNRSNREDLMNRFPQETTTSLFSNEDPLLPGTLSPKKHYLGNDQNIGMFSPLTASSNHDPWFRSTLFPPLSGNITHFSLSSLGGSGHDEMTYGSPNGSAIDHPLQISSANGWPKKGYNSEGNEKRSSIVRPSIGGLFPKSDVQSFW